MVSTYALAGSDGGWLFEKLLKFPTTEAFGTVGFALSGDSNTIIVGCESNSNKHVFDSDCTVVNLALDCSNISRW